NKREIQRQRAVASNWVRLLFEALRPIQGTDNERVSIIDDQVDLLSTVLEFLEQEFNLSLTYYQGRLSVILLQHLCKKLLAVLEYRLFQISPCDSDAIAKHEVLQSFFQHLTTYSR